MVKHILNDYLICVDFTCQMAPCCKPWSHCTIYFFTVAHIPVKTQFAFLPVIQLRKTTRLLPNLKGDNDNT